MRGRARQNDREKEQWRDGGKEEERREKENERREEREERREKRERRGGERATSRECVWVKKSMCR